MGNRLLLEVHAYAKDVIGREHSSANCCHAKLEVETISEAEALDIFLFTRRI
jgi:arginine/ornithine N-succinyltransferase beta subunit